jgi:hypothetical protein
MSLKSKTRTDEVETVRLASGNTGIKLPSGDVLDPTYISASNLCRLPASHFEIVLRFINGERERLRLHAEAAEASARRIAEEMQPTLEQQAARQRAWVGRNWMSES